MQSNLKNQKFIFLSIFLLLLFTYPLISITNRPFLFAGIPVLFLYVFFVWITAIIILNRLADSKHKESDES